ncbi:hypothetical protein [Micromonospora auratinigra]|uniref:Uncharacterized protein n=1 Tax=Micromonospora auratinigra TaxID=261654 RepID=A0A1A8ZEU4_9ACTN|nr:hypothetical protein [Micromonospora auratinigra]SBT42523.1 hypothetical protein GA0070611_2011 [Micromonospora auratinigra]
MTARQLPSGDEIRAHLRTEVNRALRRPGMYGDEMTLIMLCRTLAVAEGIEDVWRAEYDARHDLGWFPPTGVLGAVRRFLPAGHRAYDAVASIYAGFAHRVGWLEVRRRLTDGEYDEMLRDLPGWVAEDRTAADALARFGPPSVPPGSTNPRFPRTWLYVAGPDRPPLFLDFWPREEEPEEDGPVLLLAREGGRPFGESFWFTPQGRRRRPAEDDD